MPRFLPLLTLFLLFISCRRNDDVAVDKTALCLSWERLPITNVPDPSCIYFYDAATGYIGGTRGSIYKTTDSARTWTRISTPATQYIHQVWFMDRDNGFAVGGKNCGTNACAVDGGYIMKTTDGGLTWSHILPTTNRKAVTDILFLNANKGFALGIDVIYSTSNGGNTWIETRFPGFSGAMVGINFLDDQNGLITCGGSEKFYTTSNGGLTWEPHAQAYANFRNIKKTGNKLYSVINEKVVVSTSTTRWHRFFNSPKAIEDIHFINDKHGYAFGGSYTGNDDIDWPPGALYCTSDGGITWQGKKDIYGLPKITQVSFPSPQIGYGIGYIHIIKFNIK